MRVKGIIRGLQGIAAFLNSVGPQTTQPQWVACLKKLRSYWAGSTLSGDRLTNAALRGSLEKAQALRQAIAGDLAFMRSEVPLGRPPFEALVDRLNDLHLKTGWRCEPLGPKAKPLDPSQALFKMRGDDGTMERWVAQSWPVTKTLTDHLYATLGKALETGALNRLKVCRECGKYQVVDDLKTRFCLNSRKCHDDYHNRVTHAENRNQRREHAILEANRLLLEGKSKDEIRDRTRLPQRVVEKILAGDLSPNSQRPPKTGKPSKRRTAGPDPTFAPIQLTREQLATIIAEEAHRDKVYMKGIRAARKSSKQKPARKSK